MASGDHIRTAVHVAQQCGILEAARPVAVVTTRPSHATQTAAGHGSNQSPGALGLEVAVVDGSGASVPSVVHDAMRAVAEGQMQCAVTGAAMRVLHRAAAVAAAAAQAAGGNKGATKGEMIELSAWSEATLPWAEAPAEVDA